MFLKCEFIWEKDRNPVYAAIPYINLKISPQSQEYEMVWNCEEQVILVVQVSGCLLNPRIFLILSLCSHWKVLTNPCNSSSLCVLWLQPPLLYVTCLKFKTIQTQDLTNQISHHSSFCQSFSSRPLYIELAKLWFR